MVIDDKLDDMLFKGGIAFSLGFIGCLGGFFVGFKHEELQDIVMTAFNLDSAGPVPYITGALSGFIYAVAGYWTAKKQIELYEN